MFRLVEELRKTCNFLDGEMKKIIRNNVERKILKYEISEKIIVGKGRIHFSIYET